MIEPTGEMRLAFDEAPGADKDCACAICLNHRLAAVLALVARDYCLEPRGHASNTSVESSVEDWGWTTDGTRPMTDANHFDTACEDRPFCAIREHHDLEH